MALAGGWFAGQPACDAVPKGSLPLRPCESLSRDGGLLPDEMAAEEPADLASSAAPQAGEPCPPLPEMPALR